MKEVRVFITVLAIVLFVSNYAICDYFYYVDGVLDSNGWWGLKSNIYAMTIVLLLQSLSIDSEKGFLRFVLQVGSGLAVSNFIDKAYFNILIFNEKDIIMIIATVLFAFADYHKEYIKCQITQIYYKLFLKIKD